MTRNSWTLLRTPSDGTATLWTLQDVAETGKASLVGICTGSIAGLATVTPASGFVGPVGAVLMGALAGANPLLVE